MAGKTRRIGARVLCNVSKPSSSRAEAFRDANPSRVIGTPVSSRSDWRSGDVGGERADLQSCGVADWRHRALQPYFRNEKKGSPNPSGPP